MIHLAIVEDEYDQLAYTARGLLEAVPDAPPRVTALLPPRDPNTTRKTVGLALANAGVPNDMVDLEIIPWQRGNPLDPADLVQRIIDRHTKTPFDGIILDLQLIPFDPSEVPPGIDNKNWFAGLWIAQMLADELPQVPVSWLSVKANDIIGDSAVIAYLACRSGNVIEFPRTVALQKPDPVAQKPDVVAQKPDAVAVRQWKEGAEGILTGMGFCLHADQEEAFRETLHMRSERLVALYETMGELDTIGHCFQELKGKTVEEQNRYIQVAKRCPLIEATPAPRSFQYWLHLAGLAPQLALPGDGADWKADGYELEWILDQQLWGVGLDSLESFVSDHCCTTVQRDKLYFAESSFKDGGMALGPCARRDLCAILSRLITNAFSYSPPENTSVKVGWWLREVDECSRLVLAVVNTIDRNTPCDAWLRKPCSGLNHIFAALRRIDGFSEIKHTGRCVEFRSGICSDGKFVVPDDPEVVQLLNQPPRRMKAGTPWLPRCDKFDMTRELIGNDSCFVSVLGFPLLRHINNEGSRQTPEE